jgi:hypothetical protein
MSLADPAQQQQPTGLAGFLTGQPIEQQVASFFFPFLLRSTNQSAWLVS